MDEEDPILRMIEAIGELQAQALANSSMLEAMLMAHPDPRKLRDCWNRLSAGRIADTELNAAMKNRAVDQAASYHYQKWLKKLDQHHPA